MEASKTACVLHLHNLYYGRDGQNMLQNEEMKINKLHLH